MKLQKMLAAAAIAAFPLTMAAKCEPPCCEMPVAPITRIVVMVGSPQSASR